MKSDTRIMLLLGALIAAASLSSIADVTGPIVAPSGGGGGTPGGSNGQIQINNNGAFGGVAAPAGTVVGTTDAQALTNKTISSSTVNATTLQSNGVTITPVLSGTTGSIGGGALIAGACASNTVTVTGATTGMVALTDPNTYPGDGTLWDAQVTSANTVTVKVCAIVALTPTASTYNVRVLQ